MILNMKQLVPE